MTSSKQKVTLFLIKWPNILCSHSFKCDFETRFTLKRRKKTLLQTGAFNENNNNM